MSMGQDVGDGRMDVVDWQDWRLLGRVGNFALTLSKIIHFYIFGIYSKLIQFDYNILSYCFTRNMSNQQNNIIELDDSNSKPQPSPGDQPAVNSSISLNFNPQIFPKLHSLLSKKQQAREKAQIVPIIIEKSNPEPKPDPVPILLDHSETIEILPDLILPNNQQTNKGASPHGKEDKECENSDKILLVQESFEPLIQKCVEIQKVINEAEMVEEQPLHNVDKMNECDQTVKHIEFDVKLNSGIVQSFQHVNRQIHQEVATLEPIKHISKEQHAPSILDQTIPYQQTILLEQEPEQPHSIIQTSLSNANIQPSNMIIQQTMPQAMQIEMETNLNIQMVRPTQDNRMDIEEPNQINHITEENQHQQPQIITTNQHNQDVPQICGDKVQVQPNGVAEIIQEQMQHMKSKISQKFPELSTSIQYMSPEQLLQIYKSLPQETPASIPQNFPSQQIHPILTTQSYENKQQTMIQGSISLQNNTLLSLNEQAYKQNIQMDRSYIQFQAMVSLGEEALRNHLISSYPEAKESLNAMDHQQMQTLLEEVIQELKNIQPQPETSTITNTNPIQPTTVQPQPTIAQPLITKADMTNALIQVAPNLKPLIQKMDQAYIQQLYNQMVHLNIGQSSQKGSAIMKKINYDGKIPHSFIVELCSQKFPQFKDQVQELAEEEIKKIYEELSSHIGPWDIPLLLQKYKINHEQPEKETKSIQGMNNLARTHEMMKNSEITDIKNPEVQRQMREVQVRTLKIKKPSNEVNPLQSSDSKKFQVYEKTKNLKIMLPGQLRAKLIAKLPDLKDNIMRLDDKQIQKIYKESIQNSKHQQINKPKRLKFDEELKPVIIIPDKRYRPEMEKELQLKNKEAAGIIDQERTKVYEIKDLSSKKKKVKTIVLMHTEEVEESLENGFKMKRTDNGVQRKLSGCECASKLQIGELLHLLSEAIDRREQ